MDKQQHLDLLFRLAKQEQVVQSFEAAKERFIASVNTTTANNPKTKQVFTKKWTIMLTTVSIVSLSVFLLWNRDENKKPDPKQEKVPEETILLEKTSENNTEISVGTTARKQPVHRPAKTRTTPRELTTVPLFPEKNGSEPPVYPSPDRKIIPLKVTDDIPYQFPVLTEEEIAITKKKKKAMLKALAKHDKDAYVFIPGGSFESDGKRVSVQAFYMGTGEVTNFEYRTFLFDLLIQGRKDEFLKAKPDQTQWSKSENLTLTAFEEHYFSHKAYNEYPVVNVSREGAELYCKWLSEEVQKYVGDEKEGKYNDLRLPLRTEWIKAASNNGKMLPYPWGGPYTRNSKGLFLANFTRDIVKDQIDTTKFNEAIDYDNADILAPSKSFWPNALGLYNMAGNAAEMVYEGPNHKDPGTAGGSWRSSGDDIKIYAPDPYKGVTEAKPTIGFRVVSTYLTLPK